MRLRAEIVAEEEKMRKKRHFKRMQVFRGIVEGTRMITMVGICLPAALLCFALLASANCRMEMSFLFLNEQQKQNLGSCKFWENVKWVYIIKQNKQDYSL